MAVFMMLAVFNASEKPPMLRLSIPGGWRELSIMTAKAALMGPFHAEPGC